MTLSKTFERVRDSDGVRIVKLELKKIYGGSTNGDRQVTTPRSNPEKEGKLCAVHESTGLREAKTNLPPPPLSTCKEPKKDNWDKAADVFETIMKGMTR